MRDVKLKSDFCNLKDKVLDVDEEKIIRRSAEMLGIKPSVVLQTKEEFKNQ